MLPDVLHESPDKDDDVILSSKPAVKPRELNPSDFADIGRSAEVEGESSSMKETAKTMMQEPEIHPFPEEEDDDDEDEEEEEEDGKKPEMPGASRQLPFVATARVC